MDGIRDPLARPSLQLRALLQALRDHDVDWVLPGSTVLAIYGAQVTSNDLDVVHPDSTRRTFVDVGPVSRVQIFESRATVSTLI